MGTQLRRGEKTPGWRWFLGSSQRDPNPTLPSDLDGDVISCRSVRPCPSVEPSPPGRVDFPRWYPSKVVIMASPPSKIITFLNLLYLCVRVVFQDCSLE